MNMHKNARLTPSGRVLLVERIEGGWTVKRAATAAGVSDRTAYRWLGRYRRGDRHLADRSSAPHRIAHRLATDRIVAIVKGMPAGTRLDTSQQRANAVLPLVGNGTQRVPPEDVFLVLGADAPFGPRLGTLRHALDEIGPRLDEGR